MAEIEELNRSHVHMRDRDYVINTLTEMINDGRSKLQVVADFDRTLSKYTEAGKTCATSHDVLEEGVMPKEYNEKMEKLRQKYLPIQQDPNWTIEKKSPYIVEWYTKMHDLLVEYDFTKDILHNMVATCTAKLRDGCTEFFDKLYKCDIPLLIFSAGVGDVIRELISQNSVLYDNMHLVSNFMDFDKSGKAIGSTGEIMHLFNKSENAIHDSDYFPSLSHCTSLLLLGDSLRDIHMANGAVNIKAKLTIGFLNRPTDSLEEFKSQYDIVICHDESLDVVNAVVNKILGF